MCERKNCMEWNIEKLTQKNAEKIAGWNFPKDYAWTTLGKGTENEYFLLRESYRKDSYFQVTKDELMGYFSVNNRIRKEAGALQVVINPEADYEEEKQFLIVMEKFIKEKYPSIETINVMAYSTQTKAIEIYEGLGYENHGVLSSFGHDMSSYEQDGFNTDEKGNYIQEIQLVVLSKKIR